MTRSDTWWSRHILAWIMIYATFIAPVPYSFFLPDTCMYWLLTCFIGMIQNELTVICDWLKNMSMFIQRAPAPIFACKFIKILFTSAATANRTLKFQSMAIKRILKINNSWPKLLNFKILLIVIDWNF